MEDKMEKLIRSLKGAKPILNNPGNLTDSIMNRISQLPVHQVSLLLIWARAALSFAAVFLLGLFIFQQTEAQETPISSTTQKIVIENPIKMDSTCIQILNDDRSNAIETYLCYMQQNSIENKMFKTYRLQKN